MRTRTGRTRHLATTLFAIEMACFIWAGHGARIVPAQRRAGFRARIVHIHMLTADDVFDGDLVEYKLPDEERGEDGKILGLGTVHAGEVHPICKWSDECDEFLVDEYAQVVPLERAVKVLDMDKVWYSNRLVGGGMGPGNPHGEESEDCWSLQDAELSKETRVVVRPEREVWW
mmetsp:Transcript_6571/g.19489  ORF Transcript_6571/g.19489 Transcript_6571/m.19489 type:complete len:173 (-) Transcript_6571:241-759(-)